MPVRLTTPIRDALDECCEAVAIRSRALGAKLVCASLLGPSCIALSLLAFGAGCADHSHAPRYRSSAYSARESGVSVCLSPATGCPCERPGELADCGEVVTRADDYVTCRQGVRSCSDSGVWGECAGDLVLISAEPEGLRAPLALGAPASCSDENPCDPLCRQIVDTGSGLSDLPEGICSTASGLTICPRCGYDGKVSALAYGEMPSEWQQIPPGCELDHDRCPMDTECVGHSCQNRTPPCGASDSACDIDLTLGKPCVDNDGEYHIPLCNRGNDALTDVTIQIGVDSRNSAVTGCTPSSARVELPGFPDQGQIRFTIQPPENLGAGTCVEVNPNNSHAEGLLWRVNSALVVNFDAAIPECKQCNNGSVVIVDSPTTRISRCTPCEGLECQQINPNTTLKGVVFDPAGTRPLPNVLVYVPNGEVASFVDSVACDSCDSVVSGAPLVSTKTDAVGRFVLPKMPSGTAFELVIQVGRWRRKVVVAPLPSGATRWVGNYAASEARFTLSPDGSEPSFTGEPALRLRLPRTQRRCNAYGCAGEGDIPKTALIMGDADPLQCVLRRIGVADSEFSSDRTNGRIHLFGASGMAHGGARAAYGSDDSLLARRTGGGVPALHAYSVLLAPCDVSAELNDATYRDSAYASGPSYNSFPTAVIGPAEREAARSFVEVGGRLIATHSMAVDLVHHNQEPVTRAAFSVEGGVALDSPFDPNSSPAFVALLRDYVAANPGFSWRYIDATAYQPNASAVYVFGNNVEAASARAHEPGVTGENRLGSFAYDLDQSTTAGQRFATWAAQVGATSGSQGRLRWREWSAMVRAVRPARGAVPFLLGDSRDATRFESRTAGLFQRPCLETGGTDPACLGVTWGDEHVGMYQLDPSVNSAQACGRIGVVSGHVSEHTCFAPHLGRGRDYCEQASNPDPSQPSADCSCLEFPEQADLACGNQELSPEELSFEYLLFSTLRCSGELSQPGRGARLGRAISTRDFVADCGEQEEVVWQLFSWQATVPKDTSIAFFAATAENQADLAAAPSTSIGTATWTTSTWTAGNHTVDQYLRLDAENARRSMRWLRVTSVFVPFGAQSPTLSAWRVVFNCIKND